MREAGEKDAIVEGIRKDLSSTVEPVAFSVAAAANDDDVDDNELEKREEEEKEEEKYQKDMFQNGTDPEVSDIQLGSYNNCKDLPNQLMNEQTTR